MPMPRPGRHAATLLRSNRYGSCHIVSIGLRKDKGKVEAPGKHRGPLYSSTHTSIQSRAIVTQASCLNTVHLRMLLLVILLSMLYRTSSEGVTAQGETSPAPTERSAPVTPTLPVETPTP